MFGDTELFPSSFTHAPTFLVLVSPSAGPSRAAIGSVWLIYLYAILLASPFPVRLLAVILLHTIAFRGILMKESSIYPSILIHTERKPTT